MRFKIIMLTLIFIVPLFTVSAQKSNKKFIVSGMVTDADNVPIKGALVFIDNKNSGATTNSQGVYKVKVSPKDKEIQIFTFSNGVGADTIGGKTQINFTLSASNPSASQNPVSTGSNEVVNIGYGTIKQKDLTTSVNKINADDNKYASYSNIYEVLQGTPGVIVSGKRIQVQGPSSINSGTEPLLVVDGSVVSTIDDISPLTVKSISVLKGASTAIYGSRGANGVILITLIKGSNIK